MLEASRPPEADVRALAEQILAQPEYAQWRSLSGGLETQLLRWIAEYFAWTGRLHADSPALFWLLLLTLLLVALALLAHVAWSVRVALAVPPPAEPTRRTSEAPRWADEAERLARQGCFLEGTHRLVLGSIELLLRRGVIELGRSDANRVLREHLRRSALPGAVSARFLALLDAFEQRWFRDRVEDGELYRAWHELHSQLDEGAWESA